MHQGCEKKRTLVPGALACLVALLLCDVATAQRGLARQPEQVEVSVKIIEFQITKGLETGFSAYFAKLPRPAPFGRIETSGNAITSADLTFPASTAAGITVFLDRIMLKEGDIELVLQALEDENRASIISRPRTMVMVGQVTPSVIQTALEIPFENTVVVGETAVQVTEFRETGVILSVTAPEITDDDGNWLTNDDTFIKLNLETTVREEGQRIVIALDDQLGAGDNFNLARNAIAVPEFISRSVKTSVWVRDGQVLVLGGLYRNSESRTLSTAPWLSQAEDFAVGTVERFVPGNILASPLSATIGNRRRNENRRELVFLIKTTAWRPSASLMNLGLDDEGEETEQRRTPTDVITDVIEGIRSIPEDLAEGITGEPPPKDDVRSRLGGIDP